MTEIDIWTSTGRKTLYFHCLIGLVLLCPILVIAVHSSYVLGHRFVHFFLLPLAIVGVAFIPRDEWSLRWSLTRRFLKPFVPWLVVSLVLSLFHVNLWKAIPHYLFPLITFGILYFLFGLERIQKRLVVGAIVLSNYLITTPILYWGIQHFGKEASFFVIGNACGFFQINQIWLAGGILLLTATSFAALLSERNTAWKWVEGGSAIFGIVAISLLWVRCSLLGLGSLVLICLCSQGMRHRWRFSLGIVVVLFVAVLFFLKTGRLSAGFTDISKWLSGDVNSSWGIRLELWKSALCGMQFHPLVGWGLVPLKEMNEAGVCFSPIMTFFPLTTGFHSDFFELLATGGGIAVVGWLAMQVLLYRAAGASLVRRAMLFSIWLAGIGEAHWPACQHISYVFFCLWFLFALAESSEDTKLIATFD